MILTAKGNNDMKILVIFTGGTIGSSKSDGWIAPDPKTKYRLLASYKGAAEFYTAEPYTLLSENLSAATLTRLCHSIIDGVKGGYEGVIVAHGTDSLQYSAAAAAFCVGCNSVPVVFVSSGYPLESELANGEINFEAAVEFIRAKAGRGVYVSYQNEMGGRVDIHPATRALRHPEMSDKVFSLCGPYAYYEGGKITLNSCYLSSDWSEGCGKVDFCDDSGILTIGVSPAERYQYDLTDVKGVVLLPYHSGTLNTQSNTFRDFCGSAKSKGIPIFLPDLPKGAAYESMKSYSELGIIALPPCSSVALIMKLWIGISMGYELEEFIKKPLAEEFI